jgi:hypothetical protein
MAAILLIFLIAVAVSVQDDAPLPVPPEEAGKIILKKK